MEVEEGRFGMGESKVSEDLQRSFNRAHEALKAMWEREKIQSETTYAVKLPEQTLTICGKDNLESVLRVLKSVRVKGTYRAMRSGDHERD